MITELTALIDQSFNQLPEKAKQLFVINVSNKVFDLAGLMDSKDMNDISNFLLNGYMASGIYDEITCAGECEKIKNKIADRIKYAGKNQQEEHHTVFPPEFVGHKTLSSANWINLEKKAWEHFDQFHYMDAKTMFEDLLNNVPQHKKSELKEKLNFINIFINIDNDIRRLLLNQKCSNELYKDVNNRIEDWLSEGELSRIQKWHSPNSLVELHRNHFYYLSWIAFGDCRYEQGDVKNSVENYKVAKRFAHTSGELTNAEKKIVRARIFKEPLKLFMYQDAIDKFSKTGNTKHLQLATALLEMENEIKAVYEAETLDQNKVRYLGNELTEKTNQLMEVHGEIFSDKDRKRHRKHLRSLQWRYSAKYYAGKGNMKEAEKRYKSALGYVQTKEEKIQIINEMKEIQ